MELTSLPLKWRLNYVTLFKGKNVITGMVWMVAMPCSSRSSQPRTELRSPALQADSGKPQLQASANSNGKTTPRYLVIQQNTFPSLPLLKLLRANPPHHIFMFKSFKASDCSLILLLENHKQRVLTENKIKKKNRHETFKCYCLLFFLSDFECWWSLSWRENSHPSRIFSNLRPDSLEI